MGYSQSHDFAHVEQSIIVVETGTVEPGDVRLLLRPIETLRLYIVFQILILNLYRLQSDELIHTTLFQRQNLPLNNPSLILDVLLNMYLDGMARTIAPLLSTSLILSPTFITSPVV